jgi:hypothetical protein
MAANYDSHYKRLFSHPEVIHDLLVEFVSVIQSDTLRLDTLQRVSGGIIRLRAWTTKLTWSRRCFSWSTHVTRKTWNEWSAA